MDIKELKETVTKLEQLLGPNYNPCAPYDNGMIGEYVIVRCRDAGVHAGYLVSHHGRECILTDSRRLWKWTPAEGQKWLSGVATCGLLYGESKIGAKLDRIHLTENCEIILCAAAARLSIIGAPVDGT